MPALRPVLVHCGNSQGHETQQAGHQQRQNVLRRQAAPHAGILPPGKDRPPATAIRPGEIVPRPTPYWRKPRRSGVIVESNVQALPGKWAMPSPLLALVAPDVGMERVARRERVLLPFLFAVLCSLLAAAASSYRVDARDATLATLERTGQLKTMSDRQIEDQTKDAERTYIVKTVAVGAVGPVAKLGLLCVGLLALSWFVRGRAKGKALAAVAAVAMLPGAIENLLAAGAGLGRRSLPPGGPGAGRLPRPAAPPPAPPRRSGLDVGADLGTSGAGPRGAASRRIRRLLALGRSPRGGRARDGGKPAAAP